MGPGRWAMYRHILVAFNGTAVATRALLAALDLARDSGGEVRVLCVAEWSPVPPPVSGWELELERLARDQCLGGWLMRASALGRERGVPVRLAVSAGRPVAAVVAHAARRGSDLVVVGRGERGRWFGRLGGTAAGIGRRAPCPVLVVN